MAAPPVMRTAAGHVGQGMAWRSSKPWTSAMPITCGDKCLVGLCVMSACRGSKQNPAATRGFPAPAPTAPERGRPAAQWVLPRILGQ